MEFCLRQNSITPRSIPRRPMNRLALHLILSVLAAVVVVRADYIPIPLAQSSFNKDIVVEKTAQPPVGTTPVTTASMDNGSGNTGAGWYERGFNAAAPNSGLPVAGSTFISTNDANHVFQMAPSYQTNNALLVDATTGGAFALITPKACARLSFLTSAGNAQDSPLTVNYLVYYLDGSSESGSFDSYDWFKGTNTVPIKAVIASGRVADVAASTLTFNNVGTLDPSLYQVDVTLANTTSPITNIDLSYGASVGANAHAAVFAVSGATNLSSPLLPLAVAGYNHDMVVEAVARPGPLTGVTTATMQSGIGNTGVTFYEAGYDSLVPGSGLPPAGAVLTNQYAMDHSYVMPTSYKTNNALFVQSNVLVGPVALTLATPASYSGLSVLCASATSNVTLRAVIRHVDSSLNEVRTLVLTDWTTNTVLPAWDAQGAVNIDNRSLTNVGTAAYQLYGLDFTCNPASPVTTIDFTWTRGLAASHAAIFALSGIPTGALTPFRITSQARLSPSQFQLSWDSVVGTNYQVQSKTYLAGTAAWITNATVTATASSMSFTDTLATVPQRFYRVVAVP